MKKRFIVNITIISFIVLFVAIGLIIIFAHAPENLEVATGTVAEFEQHIENKHEDIFFDTTYFKVTFEDGSVFETEDTHYKSKRVFFENLQVGDELKIMYLKGESGQLNRIHEVEYNGEVYDLRSGSLIKYDNDCMGMIACGFCIIILSVIIGCITLCVFNHIYKKVARHRKEQMQRQSEK